MANTTSKNKITNQDARDFAVKTMSKMPITTHKPVTQEFADPNLTLKPDMKKTLVKDIVSSYKHTGVWEKRRGEMFSEPIDPKTNEPYINFDDERQDDEDYDRDFNWSCCGNSEKESKGCVVSKKDKHKWILSSYN
jgi:hypothetical protein